MFNMLEVKPAVRDVGNALFELGILDSTDETLRGSQTLREDLGLDSQEIIGLVVALSSLAINSNPLDEASVKTVDDLYGYLEQGRDSWLPTDVPYVLQGSITINQRVEEVISYIANYRRWPEVLDHVKAIEPEYDDGRLQSFKMHIEELSTKEGYCVQSWRYVNAEAGIIDFTQPIPPAGFRIHKGGWRFRSLDGGRTELISYHGFDLHDGASPEDSIELIRKHIQAALKTWASFGDEQ